MVHLLYQITCLNIVSVINIHPFIQVTIFYINEADHFSKTVLIILWMCVHVHVFTVNFQESFSRLAAPTVGGVTHVVSRVGGHRRHDQQLAVLQNLCSLSTHHINRPTGSHCKNGKASRSITVFYNRTLK